MQNQPSARNDCPQKSFYLSQNFSQWAGRGYLFSLAFIMLLFGGCHQAGSGYFEIKTQEPTAKLLVQEFQEAIFLRENQSRVSCVFVSQDSANNSRQTLIIRSFWIPQKGRTPYSPSATNVNIDLLSEVKGQKGFYRGAGFATMKKSSSDRIEVRIDAAEIKLVQRTADYQPVFNRAAITGSANVVQRRQKVQQLVDKFNRQIKEF